MKTQLQEYADEARRALAHARTYRETPYLARAFRERAHACIRAGKEFRSMKRQADMFRQLFDYAGGRR